MQYVKFMANVYRYENGEEREISGVAKYENMGDGGRISVKLCFPKRERGKVEFFVIEESMGEAVGRRIAETRMNQRILSMQISLAGERGATVGKPNRIKGICMTFQGERFAALWDAKGVDLKDLVLGAEEPEARPTEPRRMESGKSEPEKREGRPMEPERTEERKSEAERMEEQKPGPMEPERTEERKPEAERESEPEMEASDKAEPEPEMETTGEEMPEPEMEATEEEVREPEMEATEEEVGVPETEATEEEMREPKRKTPEKKEGQPETSVPDEKTREWEMENSEPERTTPRIMEEGKQGISALRQLPEREWPLAGNRFLLHGYYGYHHIYVARAADGWLVGVPGVYHPQEERAARQYGFTEFLPDQEGLIEEGTFGYWCRHCLSISTDL